MNILKKTILSAAVTAGTGVPATASADIIDVSWDGLFTLLNTTGQIVANTDPTYPDSSQIPFYLNRTLITGTLRFDTDTGAGTGLLNSFSFFGKGLAVFNTIAFQTIGNGSGGAGPLMIGNMSWDWHGTNDMPVSMVLDATGFLDATRSGLTTGDLITGGSLAASENTMNGGGKNLYTLPMGPGPIVTTTWNTTTIGGTNCTLGCYPSGTLPLIVDTVPDTGSVDGDIGIGGSPMLAGPFKNFNMNIDIISMSVTGISAVPVPAAVWLFASGLLGLIGVARRRRA